MDWSAWAGQRSLMGVRDGTSDGTSDEMSDASRLSSMSVQELSSPSWWLVAKREVEMVSSLDSYLTTAIYK